MLVSKIKIFVVEIVWGRETNVVVVDSVKICLGWGWEVGSSVVKSWKMVSWTSLVVWTWMVGMKLGMVAVSVEVEAWFRTIGQIGGVWDCDKFQIGFSKTFWKISSSDWFSTETIWVVRIGVDTFTVSGWTTFSRVCARISHMFCNAPILRY